MSRGMFKIILIGLAIVIGATRAVFETKPAPKRKAPPVARQTLPNPSVVKHPTGLILYQPHFYWANKEDSHNGTGFLVQAPGNKIAAVSSAHFIDFDGPALLSAEWLDLKTDKPIATLTKCWGPPGHKGIQTNTKIDLRKDYLILEATGSIEADRVLKLDARAEIPEGERIYFPNKDPEAPQGLKWIDGSVTSWTATFIVVTLDQNITLQSQSGSPILSQITGEVIGTLSRGGDTGGKTTLLLCPAPGILNVINSAVQFTPTKDIIGKQ